MPEENEYLVEVGEEDLEGSDSDPTELYEILAEITSPEEEIEEGWSQKLNHLFDLIRDINRSCIYQNQNTGDVISL